MTKFDVQLTAKVLILPELQFCGEWDETIDILVVSDCSPIVCIHSLGKNYVCSHRNLLRLSNYILYTFMHHILVNNIVVFGASQSNTSLSVVYFSVNCNCVPENLKLSFHLKTGVE